MTLRATVHTSNCEFCNLSFCPSGHVKLSQCGLGPSLHVHFERYMRSRREVRNADARQP